MRLKARAIISIPILVLIVGLISAVAFLKSDRASEWACEKVREALDANGLDARAAGCAIDFLPPGLSVRGLEVMSAAGQRLLQVEELAVELDSWALLTGNARVDRFLAKRPEVHLRMSGGTIEGLPSPKKEAGTTAGTKTGVALPGKIAIEQGRLDLLVQHFGLVQLRDVDLKAAAADGRIDLELGLGSGNLDLEGVRGTSLAIRPSRCGLEIVNAKFVVTNCELRVDELSAEVRGSIEVVQGELKPELSAAVQGPLSMLSLFIPSVPPMDGQVALSASVLIGPQGFEAQGDLTVQDYAIASVADVNLRSRFQVNLRRLFLPDVRVEGPAGAVQGEWTLNFDEQCSMSGGITIERSDLIAGLAMAGVDFEIVDLRGTGQVLFNGALAGTRPHIALSLELDSEELSVQTAPSKPLMSMAGARITAQADLDSKRALIESFRLAHSATIFEGQGAIPFKGGPVEAALRVEPLSLTDLSPALPLAGQGAVELNLSGELASPTLSGTLALQDLLVLGNNLGELNARIFLRGGTLSVEPLEIAPGRGTARVVGELGLRKPFPLRAAVTMNGLELATAIGALTPLARGLTQGFLGGQIQLQGDLAAPIADYRLSLADVAIGGQRVAEAAAIGRFENGRFVVEHFEADFAPGWLFARGSLALAGDLDAQVYSTGLRAASFQALAPLRDRLDFRLDLQAALHGTLEAPAVTGWLKMYDTEWIGHRIDDSLVEAEADASRIAIRGHFFGGAVDLQGTARLEQALPFEALLSFGGGGLGLLLPRLTGRPPPEAAVRGQLTARGQLLAPASLEADLEIAELALGWSDFLLRAERPFHLSLREGAIVCERVELGGDETALTLSGRAGLRGNSLADGELDFSVEGTAGLGLLPLFWNQIPAFAGRARLRLGISGRFGQPVVSGTLDLERGLFRAAFLSADLEELQGRLRIQGRRIRFETLRGRLGGGEIQVYGDIDVPDALKLAIELNRVRYQISSNLWATGTGSLALQGKIGERLNLSGQLLVHEGALEEHIPVVSLDAPFRTPRPLPRAYDKNREVVGFDIRLSVPQHFRVLYNLDLAKLAAEFRGALTITGTNERLGIQGELEPFEGEIDFLSKRFQIDSGQIRLTEEFEIYPVVDIQASRTETVSREEEQLTYLIRLILNGQGDNLRVSLQSEPSLDERDIITLVSLGLTRADLDRLKGQDLLGLGGEVLTTSLLKLDERFRDWFPFPPELIQPRYARVRSRYSTKQATTTPRFEVGAKLRLISEDLDLDYSGSLYDQADHLVELSYRLAPGVAARVRWEDTQEDSALQSVGDLGLDLKLRWEW